MAYAEALDKLGIVSVTDIAGRIIHVNDEFVRLSGYSRDELIGQTHGIVKSGHHSESFYRDMYRTISRGEKWRAPVMNRAKDGSFYWVDALIVPLKNGAGKIKGYFSFRIDITNAVAVHEEVRQQKAMLQGVVQSFPAGICVYDENGRLIICNEYQKKLLEFPDELFEASPPTFERIVRFNAQRGEYGAGDTEELVAARLALARKREPHVFERQRPNGSFIEVRGTPLDNGGFVTTYLDITKRKSDEETISRLAHRDPLTGLANRLMFHDRIRQGLARVHRGDTLALLCLDLDRFKSINDTLGHPIGDEVLKRVAKRLEHCVRETDTVARLGGDEFAIIQASPANSAGVATLASRIISQLAEPFKIGENTLEIGASIGIAMAPGDGTDADVLMQNADLALYRVKTEGRGAFAFFEQSLQRQLALRNRLALDLREALQANRFELHYQPIVDIPTMKLSGFEALIRWHHPERGLVPASEFIPVAEECGLIGQIGDWVLKTACRQAATLPDDIWVSVNISPAQLRGHSFVENVQNSLQGIQASRIILEITESMLMSDRAGAASLMARLRNIGVRFALDDFGTGFSSLSYLQMFPFDKIKIDRSFMSDAADESRSSSLRKTIVQLGKNLGMTCVAEGVETEHQLNCLRHEGCEEAQGYYFSRPIPLAGAQQLAKKSILHSPQLSAI
ncbi:MAG: EAL domain-containing protein [Hyphomicrobium sp.]